MRILEAGVGAGFFYLSITRSSMLRKAYFILFLKTIGKIPLLR